MPGGVIDETYRWLLPYCAELKPPELFLQDVFRVVRKMIMRPTMNSQFIFPLAILKAVCVGVI